MLVYDLLNQNNSIQRNIYPTYIEDTETKNLRRYFMFTFTYTIRDYKGSNNNTDGNLRPNNRENGERRNEGFGPSNRRFGPGGGPGN
ncbi:MAG: hypothetical protein M3142_08920 [Bacteroidota bacterium]|nr:hypothetical protein [Bacteroidota bacterium]